MTTRSMTPALLIGLALLIASCGSSPRSDTSDNPEAIEPTVIDACQISIKNNLKDPDSAQFNSWKAWPVTQVNSTPPASLTYNPGAGDMYYSGSGNANAKNGFGGYVGFRPYVCDAVVSNHTHVVAIAHSVKPGSDD